MIGLAQIKCLVASPPTPHASLVLVILSALKMSTGLNTIEESAIDEVFVQQIPLTWNSQHY